MLEAIRIRKAGYSIRIVFKDFIRRYRPCLKGEAAQFNGKPREAAMRIFENLTAAQPKFADKYQVGFTKVFLKDDQELFLEQERDRILAKKILVLQVLLLKQYRTSSLRYSGSDSWLVL